MSFFHVSQILYSIQKIEILKMKKIEQAIAQWLEKADLHIGGNAPWDIIVHNKKLYTRWILSGSLGAGEAYMDGYWDCDALDEFTRRLFNAHLLDNVHSKELPALWLRMKSFFFNMGAKVNAFQVGQKHYDIGNDLYERMLDKRMIYSCGYWKNANTLEQAQENKLDLICRKLHLEPGLCVLDIGGGWGGFSRYAAEKYQVHVVNVSVSKEQIAFADAHKRDLPIENRLQDYRDITDVYDRIVSVGMFEHVGAKNYASFIKTVAEHLSDNGLFLLHTIGASISRQINDPWIERYIFPNSMLPSADQLTHAMNNHFIIEDWHNFGADYDKTLMAWYYNFERAWPELAPQYGERFYRMWRFYLLTAAGSFRARFNQVWQLVLSKHGVVGGYESIR